MKPGTTVVFLLDDTISSSGYKNLLFRSFQKIADSYAAYTGPDNIRIAALKHGAPLPNNSSACPFILPPVIESDLDYVTQLFDFRAPKDVQVSDVRSKMNFNSCFPLLYPGIDLARQMIETECPPPPAAGTPTPTPKPWRHRKVITVLGDGSPGGVHQKHYKSPTQAHPAGDYPEQLLENVHKAKIAVNTLCVGGFCIYPVWQCPGFPDPRVLLVSNCGDPNQREIADRAWKLMREISNRSWSGQYHGLVK